jgi:hypothetical protein
MDRILHNLLNQTIVKLAYLGRDEHNDYLWDTSNPATFKARIEFSNTLLRTHLGQEALSTCKIYCDSNINIDYKDKISNDLFAVQYPEILKIENMPDETGVIYYKCIYTK